MATEPNNELDFETLIREAAEHPENKPIPNSTDYHALIAIKYLLKTAKTDARVISSEFRVTFWEKLLPDLTQFLLREGTTLSIVIQKAGSNDLINKLKEIFNVRIDTRQINTANGSYPDFLTIDSMGYRFETADDKKSLVQGIINFGDREGTHKLNELFARVQNTAIPYPVAI